MRSRPGDGRPAGVALVVTLMMMSVLTMMVVGLAGVMRNEQAAARNLTYLVLADQMAEIGAREAMAAVLSNSPANGVPSATGPGWTLNNGTLVPLFSSNAANRTVDLENMGTNSMILSVGDGQTGNVRADWTNVVPPAAAATFPVGRYAWWVDDEGTKANLNQVGGDKTSAAGTTSLLPLQTNFPLSAAQVFLDNPVAGTGNNPSLASRVSTRANAFFTPELLKLSTNFGGVGLSAANYRNFKGNFTTWSSNGLDLTPWGTPRVNLNTASLAEIQQALATNALTNFFGAGVSLGRKYGGGAASATNTDNHGDLVIRQIAANILAARGSSILLTNNADYYTEADLDRGNLRTRHGIPQTIGSFSRTPSLEAVRCKIEYLRNNTTFRVQLKVWVQIRNPYNQTFSNYSLVVRPRKFRFQITSSTDMALNGQPTFGLPLQTNSPPQASTFVEQNGRSIWAGPSTLGGAEQYWWPWGQFMSVTIPSIAARSTPSYLLNHTVTFAFTTSTASPANSVVSQAYVILDQVGLYSSATPSTPSLVDWLSLDDLNHPDNFRNSLPDPGQFAFSSGGVSPVLVNTFSTATNPASWTTANSIGVKRIDPQTRFSTLVWDAADLGTVKSGGWPANVKAWTQNTSESANMATVSVAGLPNDPIPSGAAAYTDHPHFVEGYAPSGGFRSVAQLGAVHTGLPWRTLRFLPTPAAELALGPPDWVLLDLFTVTNPAVARPMINVNSVGRERAGAVQIDGANAHRSWVLMGAMAALTNSYVGFFRNSAVSNNLATWGVPASFATQQNARLTASNALTGVGIALGQALAAPASAANWYTGSTAAQSSGWAAFRTGANDFWPDQGLAFRGELAELSALTQAGTALSEEQQEGRLRFFMDLLTTRSDTFTAWSAGQGLVVFTNALGQVRTNVMGEVRKQTVFQRVPQTNNAGAITGWQVKVLYTRNHVVE